MSEVLHAASEAEMIEAGRRFAESLRPGDVVALDGDLGSGKTHFCKGLVAGLGSADAVTSPTFALVQEYRSGPFPVHHFDWYRIGSEEELLRLGWDDYLDEDAVVVVEWAEKFPALLPTGAIRLRFQHAGEGHRTITVSRP